MWQVGHFRAGPSQPFRSSLSLPRRELMFPRKLPIYFSERRIAVGSPLWSTFCRPHGPLFGAPSLRGFPPRSPVR